MNQWAEFNLQSLFPGPVADATEQVGIVCEQIGTTAETIASAIEMLADLLVDVTDPLRALIQELITLLEETMSDILHTGIYFYYDCAGWPFYQVRSFDWDKIKQAMAEGEAHGAEIREGDVKPEDLPLSTTAVAYGWPGWQARWKQSIDDMGDLERPIFSDNAEIGAIFLVAGTPSLDGFLMLIRAIGELLGIKAFEDAWDRFIVTILDADAKKGDRSIVVKDVTGFAEDDWIVVGPLTVALPVFTYIKSIDKKTRTFVLTDPLPQDFAKGSPVAMTGSAAAGNNRKPTAPDWANLTLAEIIPFLDDLDALIQKIIGLLRVADGFLALLQELAEILNKKAQKLRQIAQMITDLIERIMAILTLTGLFFLKAESSTGFAGLYEAISEADDSFPLPADSFVFGACLLAGGADFGPLADFLGCEMGFIDTFSGATLDLAAWIPYTEGANTISIVGGRLNLHAFSGSMFQPGMAGAGRAVMLQGDFSLVVDIDATITLGPALPFGWAAMILGAPSQSPEVVGLFIFGALDIALAHVRVDGGITGVGAIELQPGISQQAARLRISRFGSTWTTEGDLLDGAGYRPMSQVSGTTGDIQVILYALCCGNPVEAFFDNYMENAAPVDQPAVVTGYGYPNLGCDLLLDEDGDLAISVTGDLALTPNGRVCLLQDIADLLETLPTDLFGHPEYGAGIGRLFGESYKAGFVRHVERAVRDALINDPSVTPRLLPETVQVDMERYSDMELSVSIAASAIDDDVIVPLNFVWQYGLDDVSRIFVREAAQ